eukprot:CAMPEP_0179478488 /NCGR_PEP_ID=MMETSP0799-20121207/56975_1 /TAXON_ID=46947 /ORGANISM="Geminigera cryophila, Strain CCMP2564" /LENGTH=60 /DNA_ID=CAMNT_0021289663 /DNA_START=738 /DNA_END=920 /DNA_ORIENTATION=-
MGMLFMVQRWKMCLCIWSLTPCSHFASSELPLKSRHMKNSRARSLLGLTLASAKATRLLK